MPQYGGAGPHFDDFAVDFENDPEIRDILVRVVPASDDKARGRTVVSDDIGERELEILVSAVDHLHRRRHRGNRGERLGHRNPTGEGRSEEHTSELPSLMRTSYAAFCLKKKTK